MNTNLKATPGNAVYAFVKEGHYVKMRDDAKEHPGEFAEIVGVRDVSNELCYTIRFFNGFTTEIPCEPSKIRKYCSKVPASCK